MEITINDLQELTLLYKNAVKKNKEIFVYKGKEILTSYAKYLIEYLRYIELELLTKN